MEILTWNINYDPRTVGENEKFNWHNRKGPVIDFLLKHDDSILCLQEATEESIVDLTKALEPTHEIFTKISHPAGRYLLTAFPYNMKVTVIDIPILPNYRECWHCFKVNDDLIVNNVHLPTGFEYKAPLSVYISEQTEQLTTFLEIGNAIMIGDWNTFPDRGGYEQTMSIQKGRFREASSVIMNAEDPTQRVLETFSAYPYDTYPKGPTHHEYHLDHIFVMGLETSIPLCTVSDASDHYALVMKFTL